MANNRIDNKSSQRGAGGFSTKYSRTEGIASYHRRRLIGRLSKVVVVLFLVVIVGGAGVLLARQFLESPTSPFKSPDVPAAAKAKEEEVEITTVQPVTATLVSAGDVILNGSAVDSGRQEGTEAYNFNHLFENIKEELSGYDIRTVAQETSLAGSDFGFGGTQPLNAPQDLGRSEVAGGFNVVLRATDHTFDTGTTGIHNELSWWREENGDIPVLGIAEPDLEENPGYSDYVSNVYVYEKDGFKIAILNHTWNVAEENWSIVSPLTEDKVKADVEQAREEGAEMIIACPHWGAENNTALTEEETTFAKVYANAGVDVIVGTHPRVLQGVDVIVNGDGHKTLCFYSLGCLISGLDGDNLLGALAEVKLSRDSEGACTIEGAVLKPVVTHRGQGTEYTTYLLSDYTDELAASSWDGGLTREHWSNRCTELLGEDFDAEAAKLTVDLDDTISVDEVGQPQEGVA